MSSTLNKVIAGFALTAVCLGAHAVTKLELDDYGPVGGGDPYAGGIPWEHTGTTIFTTNNADFFISGRTAGDAVEVVFQSSDLSAEDAAWGFFRFASAQSGTPLTVGVYEDAQRYPSPGHPGLFFGLTGYAPNTVSGRFEVFDVQRNVQGVFTSFAASFEIYGYPAPIGSPQMSGRVWYNSDVAMPAVPEPQAWAMMVAGLAGAGAAVRKRRGAH